MTDERVGRGAALLPTDPPAVGPYRVVARLGQGGMGTVYLARDPDDRPVAVKVVRADLAAEPEFRQRFRSEVARARAVPPFCTAEVLDADPEGATPYLVVEYVDGPSLAEAVEADGPLTAGNLHALAIGVATALAAIHGAGVLHRDLKPRNVLLAPGSPKVIDFGIARALDASARLTRPHQLLGTVAYLAPERLDPGAAVGPPADIFAWGAVIAYAGTGREPFRAGSLAATAARIITEPPDVDGLAPALRDLVCAALAKDAAQRPTARELLDRLLTLDASPTGATAVLAEAAQLRAAVEGATGRHPRTGRTRRPAVLAALALALLAAGGVAAWGLQQRPGGDAVGGAPSPVVTSAADPLAGDWIGELRQSFGDAEPVTLRLAPGGARGTVSYPRLGCRGQLTVAERSTDKVVLNERITAGSCTPRGRITLWPTGPSTMLLDYVPGNGAYTAHASMTRR